MQRAQARQQDAGMAFDLRIATLVIGILSITGVVAFASLGAGVAWLAGH